MRRRSGTRPWPRVVGGALVLIAAASTFLMVDIWSALGAKPSGERLARIAQSPQYRDGRFANALPTVSSGMSLSATREFFFGGSDYREPAQPLPVVTRTAADFADAASDLRVTWLGHSTLLVELDGARILVDPVWGERASPMSFAGPKRFYAPPLALADLPPLDAVVISHDHYDHLDEPTIRALAGRVPRFLVPLGIGAHLEYWGVAPDRITEIDWWERVEVGGITLVSTPARHFSGRFLTDRDATLWSGWAFLGDERRVFYSGDTALTPGFEEIGERLGPFDVSFIEAGAYNAAWADVHLGPEQAVAVHQMVRGGLLVPVHWGLFDLSLHGWTEPAERIRVAAERAGVPVAFPKPGESVTLGDAPAAPWWPELPWQTAAEAPIVSSGLPADLPVPVP
ncbi:MAG: MBL fold metallo-hydrolase [Rhodothermales bacterium]